MAISATNLTSGDNSTGGTSATTASISPTANALVIVSVAGGLNGGVAATVTGAGGTWVQIFYEDDSGTGGNHSVQMFRDLSASPGSGALTISFGSTAENHIVWSVDQFTGTDTTGTHGSGAIVQSVKNFDQSGSQTSETATLAALGSPNNAAYGYLRESASTSLTKGASFTQLSYVTVSALCMAEWAINQTAVNWTIAGSSGAISVFGAIEIKAATGGGASPFSEFLDYVPFNTRSYRDTINYDGGSSAFLPNIIQYPSSRFLNLVENAAPFNTISYRDYRASPLNPNLYPPPGQPLNPFVNSWSLR